MIRKISKDDLCPRLKALGIQHKVEGLRKKLEALPEDDAQGKLSIMQEIKALLRS